MRQQVEYPQKLFRAPSLQTVAAMAVSALLLAGCSGAGFKTHAQILSAKAESYIAAHPELDDKTKTDIRLARLNKGMSRRDVIAAWGRPVAVRKYSRAGSEYWYFGCDWPHNCSYPDEEDGYPLIDEIYQSQAEFKGGKLIFWRS